MNELKHVNSEELYNRYNSLVDELIELEYNPYRNEVPTNDDKTGKQNEIVDLIERLLSVSKVENFYWDYCPVEVYKSNFDKRKADFLEKYDTMDIDFINYEIEYLKDLMFVFKSGHNKKIYTPIYKDEYLMEIKISDMPYYLFIGSNELAKKLFYSTRNKIEYLEDKLKKLENNTICEILEEEEYPDFSTKDPVQQFVMIHELGIIDYLRSRFPNPISETLLASLISSFTNGSKDNIRKMINGSKNHDHNNKLTSENLKIFRDKLFQLKISPEIFKNKQ